MGVLMLALSFAALTVPGRTQEDAEGLKDHPVFPRHPAYHLSSGEDLEFGTFDFFVKDANEAKAEGKYTRRDYALKENVKNPGAVAVARNYRNAMAAKGAKVLNDEVDNSGGVFSAVMNAGGARVWLQVDIAADRLTTAGFGDTKPVAQNATEEARAQNRRVELVKK